MWCAVGSVMSLIATRSLQAGDSKFHVLERAAFGRTHKIVAALFNLKPVISRLSRALQEPGTVSAKKSCAV